MSSMRAMVGALRADRAPRRSHRRPTSTTSAARDVRQHALPARLARLPAARSELGDGVAARMPSKRSRRVVGPGFDGRSGGRLGQQHVTVGTKRWSIVTGVSREFGRSASQSASPRSAGSRGRPASDRWWAVTAVLPRSMGHRSRCAFRVTPRSKCSIGAPGVLETHGIDVVAEAPDGRVAVDWHAS